MAAIRNSNLYAKAAIPEVWIHNFQESILEVFHTPTQHKYRSHLSFLPDEAVTPLFYTNPFIWNQSQP